MTEILEDFSRDALLQANETNLYTMTPFFYDWPDSTVHRSPDVSWCVTRIPFPWCNTAFHAHLTKKSAPGAIEAFIAEGDRVAVPLFWFIGHDTTPTNIGKYLEARGFTSWGSSTIMAADLHELKSGKSASLQDLVITRVEDEDDLATWCMISADGFDMPVHAGIALSEWFIAANNLKVPISFYLALLDGAPVATSCVFYGGGVAGIYFVATLPEARRQGIGFEITLAPLLEARSKGYRIGVLQASKMGITVYRKMGFKKCGKMVSYIRMPYYSPAHELV
jgi:ribosomal protein S18 acetylase RimI-like enzyme